MLISVLNGLKLVADAFPFAVILPGETSNAVADVFDLQHRSFVFSVAVSGADGGVKFDV